MPHDSVNARFTVGQRSVRDEFESLGLKHVSAQPRTQNLIADINSCRMEFYNCKFDSVKCKNGTNALKNYHKKYNEEKNCFSDHPEHDWSSHTADAFRYSIIDYFRNYKNEKPKRPIDSPLTFNDLLSQTSSKHLSKRI